MIAPRAVEPRRYAVGFVFNEVFDQVVLIRKNRPTWQAGLLNGLGGKHEAPEAIEDTVAREVEEEAGIPTTGRQWAEFLVLNEYEHHDLVAVVHFFWISIGDPQDLVTPGLTDEEVGYYRVEDLADAGRLRTTPNLPWLLRMAIDTATNPRYSFRADVDYDLRPGVVFEP